MAVEGQIRHQPLLLPVLLAQMPQFPLPAQTQPGVLLLPQLRRLPADPVLPADLDDCLARLRFAQSSQNRFFAVSSLRHLPAFLPSEENHDRLRSLNFKPAWFLGLGSQLPLCRNQLENTCESLCQAFTGPVLLTSRTSCEQPQHIKELDRMFPLDPPLLPDRHNPYRTLLNSRPQQVGLEN